MTENDIKLDKKDRQILYLLDLNGRMSYSEIAKKVQISKQVAKYRIERLQKEGIIKGYFSMIDTSRLGYTTFRTYLKFRNIDHLKKKEILEYLKKRKEIWAVVTLAGKWDVALGIAVKDIYEYYNVWEDLLKHHLSYISDYKTSIYSPIYHYSKAYLVDIKDNSKIRVLGGKQKEKVDDKDLKILSLLSKNARMPLLDLSNEIKMTAEAVAHRLKILEKKEIIQGYRAMIDVLKLGYEFYKAEIRLSSFDSFDSIISYCHSHPNIYQVDKTIGGETLEIEFHVKSLNEMLKIFEEMENKFQKSIEKFDYITILSEEKTTYMPDLSL